jgi:short-subunit dehydrogenase
MNSKVNKKVILITGASQGIGFVVAEKLALDGHAVIGVSRTLPNQKFHFHHEVMDVTDPHAITLTIHNVRKRFHRLDVVINNAGIGIAGAIEETSLEAIERIFKINVFGLHQVVQASLPALKESRGYIINIGSVAGDLTIPFQTFYSMTKASVATYSEGLANELKPFGIHVTNIKPGDTKSNFSTSRQTNILEHSAYKDRIKRSIQTMEKDEKNGLPPQSVYKVIKKLLLKKNPPIHVTVGTQYKIIQLLKRLLPSRWVQAILYRLYGR